MIIEIDNLEKCEDQKSEKWCSKKKDKGLCEEDNISKKCKKTCNTCNNKPEGK